MENRVAGEKAARHISRWCLVLACALAALWSLPVHADTLYLPEQVETVEESAFEADETIIEVVLPDGVLSIGSRAFADCSSLTTIYIPASVETIGTQALLGTCDPLLIRTTPGSEAVDYALANGFDLDAETTYRALLIAQSEYETMDDLPASANDQKIMANALAGAGTKPYQVTQVSNVTADGMHEAIQSAFGKAQPQDVSLFCYCGHGASGNNNPDLLGALVGVDGAFITGAMLRSWLDEIPGRKIVIIDACYSGNLIGRGEREAEVPLSELTALVQSLIAPFTWRSRAGELAAPQYFVITAASSTQQSWETNNSNGKGYGLFTYGMGLALGYDFINDRYVEPRADVNRDGVITIDEAYRSAKQTAWDIYPRQAAQVYPAACTWFGMLR